MKIEPVPYTKELHEKIWGKRKCIFKGKGNKWIILYPNRNSSFFVKSAYNVTLFVRDLHFLQNFLRGMGEYGLLDKIENMTL